MSDLSVSFSEQSAFLKMPTDEPGHALAKKILIVEDNTLNLKLLNDLLEFRGYDIVSTNQGEAALELAREHAPDIILLDIQLPDIPGTEAARRLKADPQTRTIPIIAVTAFAMPGDESKILASGCDAYIAKPFNIQALFDMIERYIIGNPSESLN